MCLETKKDVSEVEWVTTFYWKITNIYLFCIRLIVYAHLIYTWPYKCNTDTNPMIYANISVRDDASSNI